MRSSERDFDNPRCIHILHSVEAQSVKHLTVRDLPSDLGKALERERRRRGVSLNKTVIDLLGQSLGVGVPRRRNGLRRLAGTWSQEDLDRFESAIAPVEQVDAEVWR